jgi:hypothetical protein
MMRHTVRQKAEFKDTEQASKAESDMARMSELSNHEF